MLGQVLILTQVDQDGRTACELALAAGHTDVVALLTPAAQKGPVGRWAAKKQQSQFEFTSSCLPLRESVCVGGEGK